MANIGALISDRDTDRDNPAIIYEQDHDHRLTWRFRDLTNKSNQLANTLRQTGLRRRDIVGVFLPARPETVVALAATYKLGAIALSISPLFGIDAVLYRLKHSGAKTIILEGNRNDIREALTRSGVTTIVVDADGLSSNEIRFEASLKSSAIFEPLKTKSDDPAQLFYTSGTTGPPKGVLHAHRFLFGHLPCFQVYYDMAPQNGDVFWTPADWGWIGALGDVVLPCLYFGRPVVASRRQGRFDPRAALDIMEKYNVTCAFLPPTALRLMRKTVEYPSKDYHLTLRAICSAGESVGEEIIRWGKERLGAPINEFYGCTECNLVVVTGSPIIASRPGAMGRVCPGHRVEVLDERGEVLPSGVVGRIAVKSPDPVMFLGYWKDEEATRKKFFGDWLLTGDLAYKDEFGYFWFKGRTDDVIKSAGYRIGPEEVENAINAHPAVLESAVVGRFDAIRGTIVKAFVVLKQGMQPTVEVKSSIQNLVRERLSAYAYPREIEFISEIPKTETGKIKRFELRNLVR